MGSTNHGTQDITIEYYEEATSFDVNKRNVDIVPRGIYSGGRLTKVSDTEVTLSTFTAELGDDDIQISVKTATTATLSASTLDSGTISETTPYLVLRWSYLDQIDNYVEVHAIASLISAQSNDIIIGKCVFSGSTLTGFDYTDRTFLDVQNHFLKVSEDTGLYVWIDAGRIYNTTQYVFVPAQRVGPFSVPGSPNSRIDLVYIDTDGTVSIEQGTASVTPSAPDYDGKLVVAEVTVVNGDTSIPANRIQDVRSFLTAVSSSQAQAQQVKVSTEVTSSTSETDVPGMSITMTTKGGIVLVDFMTDIACEDARTAYVILYVDGSPVLTTKTKQDNGGQTYDTGNIHMHHTAVGSYALAAGVHTFKVRWYATSTCYMNRYSTSDRVLSVVELPS